MTFLQILYVLLLANLTFGSTNAYSLKIEPLIIPQIDYEHLLNRSGPYGLPHLNVSQVDYHSRINKTHTSIIMENEYIKVVLLPAMGRVYRVVYKPTHHDVLWTNSVATPNGANNDLGEEKYAQHEIICLIRLFLHLLTRSNISITISFYLSRLVVVDWWYRVYATWTRAWFHVGSGVGLESVGKFIFPPSRGDPGLGACDRLGRNTRILSVV